MVVDSLILMVLGMGIVFVFLIMLMFAVRAMGAFLQKYFPAPVVVPVKKTAPRPAAATATATDNGAVVAAISTAISMFRKERS